MQPPHPRAGREIGVRSKYNKVQAPCRAAEKLICPFSVERVVRAIVLSGPSRFSAAGIRRIYIFWRTIAMSSSAPTAPEFTGKAINWSIFLSLCLIIAGFFTLLVPFVGGIGVAIFIGWAMVISGITHFIFAFKTPTAGSLIWELLVGAV
jgi:hypothetical protein